jgi:hypothetical protein
LAAMTKEGIVSARWVSLPERLFSPGGRTLCAAASVFVVVSLIHAVETVKFVASWSDYRNAIVVLATSSKSDPALGNPRFVSAERISPALTIVVLDYPLSVNNSLELLAESAGHRSRWKLLLVVLRNGNKEQGCRACRSGADPRIGPGLFVPTSISRGRRPMTVPRPPTTGRPVEAAADRVMLLWSLIKMVPDHELTCSVPLS